jgi:hypothetical protein
MKIINFLPATVDVIPPLTTDDTKSIKLYVNAAFAVQKDFNSHTGALMTIGNGIISSVLTKQKVSSRSFIEGKYIANYDVVSKVLWTNHFLKCRVTILRKM